MTLRAGMNFKLTGIMFKRAWKNLIDPRQNRNLDHPVPGFFVSHVFSQKMISVSGVRSNAGLGS
jgi:hypothetical protein